MRYTIKTQKLKKTLPATDTFFGKPKKTRRNGYYWVLWSGVYSQPTVWRLAAWSNELRAWKLTGDERLYFDYDFTAINEHRILLCAWYIVYLYWIASGLYLAGTLFAILYMLNHPK